MRDDAWAQARLAEHAGKSFKLALPPLFIALRIGADGALEPLPAAPAAYDLELTLPPTALPLALAGRESVERAIATRGDTSLAQALRELADAMPWFVERELAHWVGPIVAQRLSTRVRALATWPAYAGGRVVRSAATFLQEEHPTLVKRLDLDHFSSAVIRMRDDVARFELRLDRLTAGPS